MGSFIRIQGNSLPDFLSNVQVNGAQRPKKDDLNVRDEVSHPRPKFLTGSHL